MKTEFGYFDEKGKLIKTLTIDLSTVPSSDPIAFAYGINSGQRCVKEKLRVDHGAKHSELAPEYLRGFLFGYKGILVPEGTKIRKGEEQSYRLIDLNTFNK